MNAKTYLIIFMSVIYLSCTTDDSVELVEPCYWYPGKITEDENNCDCDSVLCSTIVFTTEDEYHRLLMVLANSVDECPLVDIIDTNDGETVTGYLISIEKSSCPDFGF